MSKTEGARCLSLSSPKPQVLSAITLHGTCVFALPASICIKADIDVGIQIVGDPAYLATTYECYQCYGNNLGAAAVAGPQTLPEATEGCATISALLSVVSVQRRKTMANAPGLFRLILQVDDLDKASEFYAKLLDDPGRRIPRASRHYIDCGAVILALVDVAAGGQEAKSIPDYIYFAVGNLERFHDRATALDCLSTEDVHGASAGEMVVRPWGERSFYVHDPWGNGLCFVDEKTLFTGR